MATILILYYRAVLLHRPHFIYVILHAPAPQQQKSTLSGAFLRVRSGSRAELCEHGLAKLGA